ncbi:MAG TPA: O-fucosyltransferase family protein [Thermoclostridium sp.]
MQMNRYLLIKSLGKSIWADVDHVMCQLLAAELTNRIPVVYWGMESLYSESITTNAYELFFEPVSNFSVHEIVRPEYSFYPTVWNSENILAEDSDRYKMEGRDLKSLMKSEANIVVSDIYYPLSSILAWTNRAHWSFGKTPYQVYRYLYDKYLKPKPEVKREIKKYINTTPNFRDEKPILGIHCRSNAIVNEVAQLYDLNELYKPYIWHFIERYNIRHIFLITDSRKILKDYRKLYDKNGMLLYTDSKKRPLKERIPTFLQDYPNKRHKGVELVKDTIEVIKDTYLAAQCDFFIGNGYSSLSNTVLRLKDWSETNIKLLY